MTVTLRPGESLLLNHSGVKTLRAGADLVLLVPTGEWDANGNAVVLRLVVAEFFGQNPNTQVVVTSDDEPVQLLTPDSAVPSETAADAQAAIASADLQALEGEDSQSTRLHTETLQTQSTGFDMAALLAGNLSASLNWQTPLTQRPDAQIAVKLPGVNLPEPPVLFPLSSSLTYPKGSNNLAVNKAMVLSGYSVQGQAPSNSSVTLVLKYGETADTVTLPAKVDASGKFSAQLPFKLLNAMPSGNYSITAYAIDVLQAVSPPSNSQSLYIDVKPPEKVVFDWNTSDINLNTGFINDNKAQADLTFTGKAEAGSRLKFSWMNKAGLTNPGDASSYVCTADANGQWIWKLTPDMVKQLSISGNEKTQYLTIQVTATDALDNESTAVVFNNVGLDLNPPPVPGLQIDLTDSTQLDGQTYKTLSKKSLDQSAVFSGTNFVEPQGKIQIKLVNATNGDYEAVFDPIAVESDGSWSLKVPRNKISGLVQGVYQVFVKGIDEAGNASGWSNPQTIFLDVFDPQPPVIDRWPAEAFTIDIDGNGLQVVNAATLQNAQKKFGGTAEAGSTVILTVYDTDLPPHEIKKTVVTDTNGRWEVAINSSEWGSLTEGVISYSAIAIDLSGNDSDPTEKIQLYLDTTPPVDPTVRFSDAVMQRTNPNKPLVRFLNREDFQNGTLISGTGERGSSITLEINGTVVANQILVNSDGTWRYVLINSEQRNWNSLLGDGAITVKVFATDLARNISSTVNYTGITVEKHTDQPAAPTQFQLAPGEDTGRSSDPDTLRDNKTNKVAPKLQWNISPGLKTYIWYDSNGNGVLDAQEKTPTAVSADAVDNQNQVSFQVQILGQGQHTYFVTTQDEWGNYSEPKSITLTLDNSISNPVFDGFQGDTNLSLDEFNNRANITLSGTTLEEGCVVKIALFDHTGDNKIGDWVEVRAVNKNWRTENFFKNLTLSANGSFILRFVNTDEAGNTTETTPLDVRMNIRSTPLNDVSVVRLSADTDSGNSRANTQTDNVTRISTPVLEGQVAFDPDADMLVRLYDSTGRQLVSDAQSPTIAADGKFSFALQPEWLTAGETVKFILRTYDAKTGTLSAVSKEVGITLDQSYDTSKFTLSPVTDGNVINYDEFNSIDSRPKIEGTSEVNSEITIVLSKTVGNQVITQTIQSSQITYTTGSDGKEYWSTEFTQSMGNLLGDGRIEMQITAKDRAGNTYVHPSSFFDLQRGQLPAPQALRLRSADDTGVSNADNITQGQAVTNSSKRAVTLLGDTNTTNAVEVTVFNDKNKNGVLDAGDDTLETFTHSGNSTFQKTYQLDDGEYTLLNTIKDSNNNQSSAPSDKLTVTIDTVIDKPSDIAMGTNSQISLVEYENSTFAITGKGEANATVYLQFKLKSSPSADLLTQPWTAQVNSEGVWRLNLSKTQMDALTEGELVSHVYQKDRAGNVSLTNEVELLFDKTPPSVPTAPDIASVLDNYYRSNNLSKPWERPGKGIVWTDIFQYNNSNLTQTEKFVSLAIALPNTGSKVKAGDTVKLTWGEQALNPVTVTAQDIANGYVLVQVMGDTINRQGKSNGLDVKALFTDQVGNKSAEFQVLSGILVSLDLKSPSLDLSESSQNNLGDLSGQDTTWYSNQISSFKLKGVADPGATVKVYAKRTDGVGGESVLTTIVADSITGNYEQVLNLTSLLTQGVRYALQSESTVGNLTSVRSDAEFLNVNSVSVSSPVLNMQTLGGDGYVNSAERNAGVLISGNSAPAYAKIQIKLTNISTGVDYYVNPFYALQNGTWSCELGIIEWGVVGEGTIEVEVKQTNIYGDSSAYTKLVPAVVFDATVNEPLLNTVSGDNYINQVEYQASSSRVIQISGKAEPGAKLSVTLVGANGGVYTPSTRPTVESDSTWVLNLDKSNLDTLGPGKVTVVLSQEDLAGNVSPISKNTFFTIDLSSDDLSLDPVTADNLVNDVEKDQGVTLSGNAEAGSWIQITLKQNGVADLALPGFKANGSTWVYALNKTGLAPYSDGLVTVHIQQTDLAGNLSSQTGNFTLRSSDIQEPIVISTWGQSPTISLAEQVSTYVINGTGPANSELNFQFIKADGSVINLPTVNVNANGQWQWALTPSQMANLQGQNTLRYWATRAEQSTVIKQLNLLVDSNYPSPRLDEVGEDGSVSLTDILSTPNQTLTIKGDGEKYSTVSVSFRGSNNLTIPSKEAVVNNTDGSWSVMLTQDELQNLTDGSGKVFLTLVQKDNNSNRVSVAISKSFEVDMLAPALPSISEQADAKNFNTVVSGNVFSVAADGTVSDTDAKNGVDIAVPLAKVGGNFVLSSGDSLTIRWGDQLYTKLLTSADIPVGKNYLVVKVPLDVIAKAGDQTDLTVAVVYTDKSGNSSQPLVLISDLVVTPPPPAPSIDTISSDGFINKDEWIGGLEISGQSLQTQGLVSLVFTSSQDAINSIKTINDINVQPNGKWTTRLSEDLLRKWADGQYFVFATYTVDGRTSVSTKSVFAIDRVEPNAIPSANTDAANLANAVSEVAGGVIRPRANSADADRYDNSLITEAAKDVNVRVALPANAKVGDFVKLTWGGVPPVGVDNTVEQALSNADIGKGYMSVRVPSSLIAEMGDYSGNNKLTITAQFFDSAQNYGHVFQVSTGLNVDAVPLPVTDVSSNFGDWLNLKTAQSGWTFRGGCEENAEIEITMVGSSGYKTPPIRYWKNNGVIQTSDGQWSVSQGLDQTLALQLGEGVVFVSIIQRDTNGNPSAPYEFSFRIDLTPPPSPAIDNISKLTYSKYEEGKTITGQVEKNATVTVYYEWLDDSDNLVFTSDKKTADINDDTWRDTLSKQDFDDFLARTPGKTGGKVRVNVYQTDLAGNDSVESEKVFAFESQPLSAPVILSVSGLDFSNAQADAVLSQSDLTANSVITVEGTTSVSNSQTRLVLQKVNGMALTWDIDVPANISTWSKSIGRNELTRLGDGQYKLFVSTRVRDADGNLENESLPKALAFQNGQDYFTIDTNGPVCQSIEISANGINGNAKAGDVVKVVLNFSEFIKVDTSRGSPKIVLQGFSDGLDREAIFINSNPSIETKQMVFQYTVDNDVQSNGTSLAFKQVDWNQVVVTDLYGNPRANTLPVGNEPHNVIVDTQAPTYTPAIQTVNSTHPNSSGGEFLIEKESLNTTVRISLSDFPVAELGASLLVTWKGTDLLPYLITAEDISNGWVDIALDKSWLSGLDETIRLTVKLQDIAGNLSPQASLDVKVDTIKPGVLTLNTWMSDNLISATEYSQLTDITGAGYEAGTTLTAMFKYKKLGDTLGYPLTTVNVNPDGTWSIPKEKIADFLRETVSYGPFELHVWQTDQRGNDSDITIQSYFIDTNIPNPPSRIEISGEADTWLNANETSRLELKISFDNLNSPKENDKIDLQFWKYAYKQPQRPANTNPDFSLTGLVITSADISAGYKLVTLTTSALQQTSGQPVQEIDFEIKIIDQGNNVSSVKRSRVHLDTLVKTPVVDTDSSTVVGGVTPTTAQSNQHFKGRGVELLVDPDPNQSQVLPNSTNLTIVFRSQYGNKITKTHVPYNTTDGSFDQLLTPNDFIYLVGNGRTEAVVYYEVFQTDKAGNVSGKVVDSFNVSLALSPPVLQSFTGDNIVNIAELTAPQKLAGVTVPNATVSVKMFVTRGNTLVQIGTDKTAVSDAKGDWFVSFTTAELAELALEQPENFSAYFEARTSKSDQVSQPSKMEFQVVRSVPALSGDWVKFDANGDGANNDGLELSLTDAVLVRDLIADLKSKGLASGKWGKNFRIEAVDSVKVNGDYYAKTFRIYLGADHSLSSASPIVLSRTSLINVAKNLPSADLTLIPPSFLIPITINMDSTKFVDNMINANELQASTSFKMYMVDDRLAFKPASDNKYTIYLNGQKVLALTDKPLADFANFTNTNWLINQPNLNVTLGKKETDLIKINRDGIYTLTAQIYNPSTESYGYYSVPHAFTVDTQVDTDMKQIKVTDTDNNGRVSQGDKLVLSFAEAVNLSETDLPSFTVNGDLQKVFGNNATLKAIGGVYTSGLQDNTSLTTNKGQVEALEIAKQMLKSNVWEITLGDNPTWTPGSSFELAGLVDNAGNVSTSFTVLTQADMYSQPGTLLIDVVSKDNVISATDAAAPVNVSVKLTGAKVGDVVKLYMDGTANSNLVGTVTVSAAHLQTNSVSVAVSADQWGGDGMRNLTATIQRGTGSVVTSDMRNVSVSTTADHWSATGKIIWFDTDNIVQETGTNVMSWQASVGGSVATTFTSSNMKAPMLVRNAVNGHNQLFFNGPDYTYDAVSKRWVVTQQDATGIKKGSFMYFNDPQNLFANYSKDVADVVPNKISYTVIANGRKDANQNGFLTSIGANGSNYANGFNGGDFKLSTGNVGLAYWGQDTLDAYQGQNRDGLTQWQAILNNNNPVAYSWDTPFLKPGVVADLGFNPFSTQFGNGMVQPVRSGTLGTQLLLSHVYDASPYANGPTGDVSFFSNSALIGHRVTDYKIVLGGGKPAGNQTYPSENDQYKAIMATQFLIGAMNQTQTSPNSLADIEKNVTNLWRGMIGDIVWAAKAIKGAALQEINTYQAVKFGTVGYFVKPSTQGSSYNLSSSDDKMNLLDDVLLLNQDANAGNGAETVTVAGADYVTTGNANDTLILKDLNFRYLDGGRGEDTLKLDTAFSTKSVIYLSDYVSNARGDSSQAEANSRVNTNGYHKLAGFETIDLSSNSAAQTLSLNDLDIWQLSDTRSLKIKMDNQDLLLTQNLGSRLQGHFYQQATDSWYDGYYAPNVNAKAVTLYTQGGDRLTSLYSFDLSNNNKILDLNFDHSLKIDVGANLQIGDFSVTGLGPYSLSFGGLGSTNPTTVSFNDLQRSLRFQSTDSVNGPLLIQYTGNQLQDTQGRPIPSYTWMIGSDLPNQDYDNYKILNANSLSLAVQKAGVMMAGGAGEDVLTGGLGADTLIGGLDSDTLIGGDGSDTFVFAKDSGDIGGITGDVIKDFNFGKNGGVQADTISLYQLFDSRLVSQLGKGAVNDASTLSSYVKLEWTKLDNNLQMVCSVDQTGNSNFSKLFTMTDLIHSVGDGNFNQNQVDQTRLYGGETTSALLQKMLEEGRLVVQ